MLCKLMMNEGKKVLPTSRKPQYPHIIYVQSNLVKMNDINIDMILKNQKKEKPEIAFMALNITITII